MFDVLSNFFYWAGVTYPGMIRELIAFLIACMVVFFIGFVYVKLFERLG